jgi:hypothetical protein
MDLSGCFHASTALLPGKQCRYSLDKRLGGPQNRTGWRGDIPRVNKQITNEILEVSVIRKIKKKKNSHCPELSS